MDHIVAWTTDLSNTKTYTLQPTKFINKWFLIPLSIVRNKSSIGHTMLRFAICLDGFCKHHLIGWSLILHHLILEYICIDKVDWARHDYITISIIRNMQKIQLSTLTLTFELANITFYINLFFISRLILI